MNPVANWKWGVFGITIFRTTSYFQEGISIIEDGNGRYNLVLLNEENNIEISKLGDIDNLSNLKIIVKDISSHKTDEKDIDLIDKLIKDNEFES